MVNTEKSNATSLNKASSNILINHYHNKIETGLLSPDHHQLKILEELQEIYNHVIKPQTKEEQKTSFLWLFSRKTDRLTPVTEQKGLYLWGGVGRGKTHLVDMFYEKLPIKNKLRLHFHRFMQLVHEELGILGSVEDPLKQVAGNISKETRLLCLDELHVIDITDAMLLARLLKYLFEAGIILVTTSNFHPDELYKDGLQRAKFLPAIALLKEHTKVIEMTGDTDYRTQALKKVGKYYYLNSEKSDQQLETHFKQISDVSTINERKQIFINNRHIPVIQWTRDVVWFTFEELCNTPRSSEDYRQIATFFHTVLISDIPVLTKDLDDAARRFINMIDTFYDMHINIVVSAATTPEELYEGNKLEFEFQRASSRIKEMQTFDYIKAKKTLLEKPLKQAVNG